MTRTLDIPATILALHLAEVPVDFAMARDPNPRRIIEALCVRHNVDAVFKDDGSAGGVRSTRGQRDVPLWRRGKLDRMPPLRRLRSQLLVRARAPSWAISGLTMWRRP